MSQYNVDEAVVKKPQHDRELTEEEQDEWIKCALDKEYWMRNYAYVQTPKGKQLFNPRDYQKDILDQIQDMFTVTVAPRQAGKALALDTIVPTPSGYTTMGDIKVGDYVIDHNGAPTRVIGVSDIMYDHPCYSVKFSTGEEVIADAEHLWEVMQKDNKNPKILTTQEIVDRGILTDLKKKESRFSINNMKCLEAEDSNIDIDPYILGYWLGDGHSYGGRITVNYDDADNLINNIEKCGMSYNILDETSENCVGVYVHDLHGLLKDNDLYNNKHIPVKYLRSSYETRIALLQGIMDSDGHVSKEGKMELTFKSYSLLMDFHELLSSLGIRAGLPKEKIVNTFKEGSIYYRINFTIYRDDFISFRLNRKIDRQKKSPSVTRKHSTKKRQICAVTPVESVPVRCIRVDNERHLFCITRSFIPTHNTVTVGIDALHDIIFTPDFNVGITSYKLTNCKDFLTRIKYAYENLPNWMKPPVTIYNQSQITFTNHSSVRVQVTTESTFRGFTLQRIILDEFAFVKPNVADEFWTSLLPSLAADGEDASVRLNIISTPNGTSGQFANIWFGAVNGANGFNHLFVDWQRIPGRTEEFKKSMLKKMNRNKYLQEFECVGGETIVTVDGEETTIGGLYERCGDMTDSEFKHNENNLKILSESGNVSFDGVMKTKHDSYMKITFTDGSSINCSKLHQFKFCDIWIAAIDIVPGIEISSKMVWGVEEINDTIYLYDIVNTEDHTYITNDVVSHNCAFISDKGTLVNSMVLENIKFKPPTLEIGDLRLFVDDIIGRTLALACDVSEGIGQDSHAIQIFDLDSMEQIGEFQNNYLTQTQYVVEIIKILKYLYKSGAVEIYYTVEANSVGAGVMRLIENSNEPVLDRATLISELESNRLGILTTSKNKLSGCLDLKDAIEMQKLKLNSERLVTELKFFIRKGQSFAAEPGMHDDLVMSTVLFMNMLKILANYEDHIYDVVNEIKGECNEDEELWGISF